jgi:CRP-like cAMP-binding protein
MTSSELVSAVRSVLCQALTVQEAGQLVQAAQPVTIPAGSVLFTEGEASTGLFLLLEGTAEVVKRSRRGGNQMIATVTAPTVIGEMGLLTDRPRSATVRAGTDCELHLLPKAAIQRLIETESLAAYKLIAAIADVLARRLELMDEKVVELAERHQGAAPVEELAAFGHKLFTEWMF